MYFKQDINDSCMSMLYNLIKIIIEYRYKRGELTSPLAMNSSIASTASLNALDLLDFTKVSLNS